MNRVIAIGFLFLALSCSNRSEIFVTPNGKAISGYDPVAYFKKEKPVKGLPEYKYEWRGATWNFSTHENQQLFASNPEKYAPRYGGYCAYGMSNGYKAATDPEAWSIVDGKLYLNYNMDVREEWFAEKLIRIIKADQNWNEVKTAPFK
jgi:YHS domain-containing protein